MRHVLMTMLAFALAGPTLAADCDREQRQIMYSGEPVTVYVSPGQWTEVVFPERAAGYLPETPEGLDYRENPSFADRVFFQVVDPLYAGTFIVNGQSGATYYLQLLARKGCADSSVTLTTPGPAPTSTAPNSAGVRKTLMEYMLLNEQPPGYNRQLVDGSYNERLVYAQGSVYFYLHEVYRGRNYTGYILHAVNYGRTPYRVDLPSIDFTSPTFESRFGSIAQVTMEPFNFQLGPAPEFSSDAFNVSNQGILYLVSRNFD